MKIERIPVELKPHPVRRAPLTGLAAAAAAGVILLIAMVVAAIYILLRFDTWTDTPRPEDNGLPALVAATESILITNTPFPRPAVASSTPTSAPTDVPASLPTPTPAPITAQSGEARGEIHSIYADAQRIAVNFSLTNLPEEIVHPPDGALITFTGGLQYADGALFNAAFGGSMEPAAEPGTLTGLYAFDHLEPAPARGTYDLIFTVRIAGVEPNGAENLLYEFTFNLDNVSVIGGASVQVNDTQTANGVNMTLQGIALTPSQARLTVCFDLPPGSFDWSPKGTLTLDGQVGQLNGWRDLADKETLGTGTNRCLQMDYSIPYTTDPHQLTFAVDRLQTSPPEVMSDEQLARAKERLAAQGIEVEFIYVDHGAQHEVIRRPEGMTDQEVWQAIYDAQTEQHPGPWLFEVALP